MSLILIIVVSIFQMGLYLVSAQKKIKYGRLIIFLMVLIGHLFIFPPFFYPDPDPNGINCGMPVLGITLAFWIFGGGAAIFTHLIYYFFGDLMKDDISSWEPTEILDSQEGV